MKTVKFLIGSYLAFLVPYYVTLYLLIPVALEFNLLTNSHHGIKTALMEALALFLVAQFSTVYLYMRLTK